jgi:tousled-like kinase
MSEDNKENYVKHVLRECDIQRTLKHENIIKFIDAFAINEHCYCHVMEHTEGVDLDTWLKAHGHMNEKEARGVLVQIWHALRYMNEGNRRVCHFDIKPGNLIYHDGRIAVLDFGLAKIVHDSGARGAGSDLTFDLTSQGAGTYYYLPPECFAQAETRGATAGGFGGGSGLVRISNKVDVWSVGCVFFELLFNRKPFGHGKTQEMIFRQGVLRDLTPEQIDDIFPKTPKVSKEAKEYIRTLLTVDKSRRPDIFAASNDPYLRRPL